MKQVGAGTRREFDLEAPRVGHVAGTGEAGVHASASWPSEWIGQQVKRDEEITYDQMVAYYREHQDEFTTPARAQWEELMVSYAKYPSKAAAYDAIARMGNQVLAGAPFAEVAKAGSDGVTAANGGRRDWTSKGSLVCQELDAALFSLPVGQLSPIIEGPNGFHIIRVTRARTRPSRRSWRPRSTSARRSSEQRSEKQFREYMAKLEARTPVWTIFDEPSRQSADGHARPAAMRR